MSDKQTIGILLEALKAAAAFIESGESSGKSFFEVRGMWRDAIATVENPKPMMKIGKQTMIMDERALVKALLQSPVSYLVPLSTDYFGSRKGGCVHRYTQPIFVDGEITSFKCVECEALAKAKPKIMPDAIGEPCKFYPDCGCTKGCGIPF